jgi:hypothetical protein
MTELKTEESTLQALQAAALRPLTSAELWQQRVSFVMGSLGANSSLTREKIEQILAGQLETQPPERVDYNPLFGYGEPAVRIDPHMHEIDRARRSAEVAALKPQQQQP